MQVDWDSGETEALNPWDLEAVAAAAAKHSQMHLFKKTKYSEQKNDYFCHL
jgi:hypothetical protein